MFGQRQSSHEREDWKVSWIEIVSHPWSERHSEGLDQGAETTCAAHRHHGHGDSREKQDAVGHFHWRGRVSYARVWGSFGTHRLPERGSCIVNGAGQGRLLGLTFEPLLPSPNSPRFGGTACLSSGREYQREGLERAGICIYPAGALLVLSCTGGTRSSPRRTLRPSDHNGCRALPIDIVGPQIMRLAFSGNLAEPSEPGPVSDVLYSTHGTIVWRRCKVVSSLMINQFGQFHAGK